MLYVLCFNFEYMQFQRIWFGINIYYWIMSQIEDVGPQYRTDQLVAGVHFTAQVGANSE